MSRTKTEIGNMALSLVSDYVMTDFLSDTTKGGILVRLWFDEAVQDLLEEMSWAFATKRVTLDELIQSQPEFDYTYAFELPDDYVYAISVSPSTVEWEVNELTILSSEPQLGLTYVSTVQDTSAYTSKFRMALIYSLASKICFALTRSTTQVGALASMYELLTAKARHSGSMDNSSKIEELDYLNNSRQGWDITTPPRVSTD